MTNKHLEPFLKRRGLILQKKPISGGDPEAVKNNILTIQPQGSGGAGVFKKLMKMVYTSPKQRLAIKYVTAIKNSLQKISQDAAVKKDNETRLEKFFVPKPIDLEYGGGFLVFGKDFKIQRMIHVGMFEENPLYKESEIQPNMALENIISGEPYNVEQIVASILEIITNGPSTRSLPTRSSESFSDMDL
jgi:hypothetical protein